MQSERHELQSADASNMYLIQATHLNVINENVPILAENFFYSGTDTIKLDNFSTEWTLWQFSFHYCLNQCLLTLFPLSAETQTYKS